MKNKNQNLADKVMLVIGILIVVSLIIALW